MVGDPLVDELLSSLAAAGDPVRAAHDAGYLRSTRRHLGVAVPTVRRLSRDAVRRYTLSAPEQVRAVAEALWVTGVYDACAAAVEVVRARQRLLGVTDLAWIESMLRDAGTWALVDELARHTVAAIVAADPSGLDVLDRWVDDDDFWIRRSAVLGLTQVLREGRELDRFFGYADRLIDEREFFIRKVLGWVMREVARTRPRPVSDWCWRNLQRMNLVTLREAVKPLPDGAELMAAYRARRNRPG